MHPPLLGPPEATLVPETHHTGDMRCTATFSPDPQRTYRYTLARHWDDRRPTAILLMLNPSTATAKDTDTTITRCLSFARSWHAGGLLVLNLFALRATNPAELSQHAHPVGPANDAVLEWYLPKAASPAGPLVVAWGGHRVARQRAALVSQLLQRRGLQPLCLGTTAAGDPRHPSRLSANAVLREYRHPFPTGGGPAAPRRRRNTQEVRHGQR